MTITVTQIANSQTFGAWLATTNKIANIISQNTVTTDTSAGGSLTTGNGFVNGYFGANYVYVNSGLVGGNISTNGQILVLSNTIFQYSATNLLSITGNTTACTIVAAVNTFTLTTNTLTATANTIAFTGVATMANTLAVTGNVTANAFLGNGNFLTTVNASNITTGTLPMAQLGSNVVNTTGSFTLSGVQTFQANLVVGATSELIISNGAGIEANGTLGTTGQVLASNGTGVYWLTTAGSVTSIATGNGVSGGPITSTGTIDLVANNGLLANTSGLFVVQGTGVVVNATGVHVNSTMFVNTSATYTITGLQTHQANLHTGNSTVNTQLSNSTIRIANSTSTTTLGLADLRLGSTSTNVIISNTTSSFAGNVVIVGTANVAANLVVGSSGELIIAAGAGIQANGSFGSNGQVLSSNGSSVYWANVASGGGGGAFNTNISNSVGFAVNSTMSAAFTAPSTAGLTYIIHSIHVTNIGGANTGISGEFEGTSYANISFATTVPIPAESAVELLKAPKVMQPDDILKLQVDDNTALHATITLEAQTTTNLFGAGIDVTADATYTDLYTASANAVLQSVLLSNDDGVNDVKARVVWADGSDNILGYYCFDLIIPADSTVEILEQPKFLQNGSKVRVYANAGGRLEAIIAGRLIQ